MQINVLVLWGRSAVQGPSEYWKPEVECTQSGDFHRYPNEDGEHNFQCGHRCYIENRIPDPNGWDDPLGPQAECCYNRDEELLDSTSPCRGTPDYCDGHSSDPYQVWCHSFKDPGGPWIAGGEAWIESHRRAKERKKKRNGT